MFQSLGPCPWSSPRIFQFEVLVRLLVTPTTQICPKVMRYKWEAYRDTMGGVPRCKWEGHQEYFPFRHWKYWKTPWHETNTNKNHQEFFLHSPRCEYRHGMYSARYFSCMYWFCAVGIHWSRDLRIEGVAGAKKTNANVYSLLFILDASNSLPPRNLEALDPVNPKGFSKFRRRTTVQQITCNIDLSCFFLLSFLLFCYHWAKTLCLKGKARGEKLWKKKMWTSVKRFCPLVVAL